MFFRQVALFLSNWHIVLEDLLGLDNNEHRSYPQQILSYSITFIATTLYFTIIGILYIFRLFLHVYLAYKHGDDYVGLLSALDAVNECNEEKIAIQIVMIFNATNSIENVIKCVRTKMRKAEDSCLKLTCTVKSCLGYSYYLQTRTIGDISVVSLNENECITKDDFKTFINERFVGTETLHDRMWHVTIIKQPLNWNSGDDRQHGFIISVRHCIGDGAVVVGMLKNKLFDNTNFIPIKSTLKMTMNETETSLTERYVYKNPLRVFSESDVQHFSFQSKELLTFFTEDSLKYLPMLKSIKKHLNVQFDDVLIAGIVVALSKYAHKKKITLNNISGAVVIKPFTKAAEKFYRGNIDFNKATNESELLHFDIPVQEFKDPAQALLKVNEIKKRAFGGAEVLVQHVITKMLSAFPGPVLSYTSKCATQDVTFTLTNVSGIQNTEIEAKTLHNVLFFASQFYNFGFCFYVFTVAGKFQIALKSKKGVVENLSDLDQILKDVFDYIDVLREQLQLDDL